MAKSYRKLIEVALPLAEINDASGQRWRARSELEKLYAEDPDYEDVAARLGL